MPRTCVAWGAWLARGLLAPPVQYFGIAEHLVSYRYVKELPGLLEALHANGVDQAVMYPIHLNAMLRSLHKDMHTFNELHGD